MHYEPHIFQEIVDGVYQGDVQAVMDHLETCNTCKSIYDDLLDQERLVDSLLNAGMNEENLLPKDDFMKPERKNRSIWMKNSYKKYTAAAAALILVASVIFIEPVSVKAGEFLQLFRMSEMETVAISDRDLAQINDVLEKGSGQVELEDFLIISADEKGKPESKHNPEEDDLKARFPDMMILPLAEGSRYDSYEYTKGTDLEITVHVDKANDFLAYIGEDARLPEMMDRVPFGLHVGETLMYGIYFDGETYTRVMQTDYPEITLPDGVSEEAMVDILLSLKLLPRDVRNQLEKIDSLASTSPIPVMSDHQSVEERTIGGSKAILVKDEDGSDSTTIYFTYDSKLVTIYTSEDQDTVLDRIEETY